MALPSTTFATIDDLISFVNTYIIPNGIEEITGDIHNSASNGFTTYIKKAVLNYELAKIESGGGVIVLSKPISIISATPTTIQWPDDFVNEFYIANGTSSDIALATGFTYVDAFANIQTTIPANTVVHIAKMTNGGWLLVGSTGAASTTIVGADNGLTVDSGVVVLGGTLIEDTTVDTGAFGLFFDVAGNPTFSLQQQGAINFAQVNETLAIGNSTWTTNTRTKLQIGQPFYFNSILSIFDTTGVANIGNPSGDRPALGVDVRTTVDAGLTTDAFVAAAGYMTVVIRPLGNWTITNVSSQAANAFQTNMFIFPATGVSSSTINLSGGGILAGQYAAIVYANNGSTPAINITNGFVACYVSDYQQASGVSGTIDNVADYYAGDSSQVAGSQLVNRRIGFYSQQIAGNCTEKWAFFAEFDPSWFGGTINAKDIIADDYAFRSGSGSPIVSDITDGFGVVWKDTGTSALGLFVNDGGIIRQVTGGTTVIEAASFTSTLDGTTVFTPLDKSGGSMVGYTMVQLIKEIQPLKNADYTFSTISGDVTLNGGITLDNGQTMFYTYIKP